MKLLLFFLLVEKKGVLLQLQFVMQKIVHLMDRDCFGQLIDHPGVLTPNQWEELQQERDHFPFCALLQLLALLADKANGVALWEKISLPRVSLYFPDAARLMQHLEAVQPPQIRPNDLEQILSETTPTPADSDADASPLAKKTVAQANEDSFDVLQAINSYQEVSFKTAPKSVILTNFLEKDGGIKLSDDSFEDVPVQELAKKSICTDNSLGSETLALVLENQGKLTQAIAIYEKLIVNNPEKSSTFANRISALKERLSSENK